LGYKKEKIMYHTKIEIENEDRKQIAEVLAEKLPHGSGIDGNWTIYQKSNPNVYYASNFYHAMDEFGGYDRCYDFTLKYTFNGFDKVEPCNICFSRGLRDLNTFWKTYHPNKTRTELINFLIERGHGFIQESDTDFVCSYCSGSGILKVREFNLDSINFHGQYIKVQHDWLRDYLFDICILD
jgi:hypothetical protein